MTALSRTQMGCPLSGFSIQNNQDGFDDLFSRIQSVSSDVSKIKVGLEATGHYSYNLLGYLFDKGLTTFVINPLHTNLYKKSFSLRTPYIKTA